MNLIYFLKMTFRSWSRNLLSSVISILSLAVGLACSVMLILFVLDEYRISNAFGNPDSVYLLKIREAAAASEGDIRESGSVSPELAYKIASSYPDAIAWATLTRRDLQWPDALAPLPEVDGEALSMCATVPAFAEMFDIPVVEGDLHRTLSRPGEIALTSSMMRALFGDSIRLGMPIVALDEWWDPETQQSRSERLHYVVTTILDDSRPLPFRYAGFCPVRENDVMGRRSNLVTGFYTGFLQLRDGVHPDSFLEKINADSMLLKQSGSYDLMNGGEVRLGRIPDLYWDPEEGGGLIVCRNPSLLVIGLTVALVILVIACFNYINVTMTRAGSRIKNLAGQRIMGASVWSVRRQIVGDTILQTLAGFLIALLIMYQMLPGFNSMLEASVSLRSLLMPGSLIAVGGLLVVLIVLASGYILMKTGTPTPLQIFRTVSGSRLGLARTMVIAQFVVSLVLVAVSLGIMRQMDYIFHQRPYSEAVVQLSSENSIPESFVNRLKSEAWVEAGSPSSPFAVMMFGWGGRPLISLYQYTPSDCATYGLKVVQGRLYTEGERPENIVVNEAMVRAMEWKEPVGTQWELNRQGLGTATVIGVVRDELANPATEAIGSAIYTPIQTINNPTRYYLKSHGRAENYFERIQELWHAEMPQEPPLELSTLIQKFREMHPDELKMSRMVGSFSQISMLLTALGLFGLAWYTVERRRREIALRKVHGATRWSVVGLLCKGFLQWVLIAVVIALPVAWWVTEEWLKQFVYKQPVSLWLLLLTALIAAVVTFLTVITQSWRAASTNPAVAVKSE